MLFNKYLNRYYLKYAWLYLIGIAALLAVNYFQLLIPEYLGQLVDLCSDAEKNGTALTLAAIRDILLGVLLVAAVLWVGRTTWRITIFNASGKMEAALRHDMFLKAERLSQRYYHENSVGTVMAWFTNDIETVEENLGWGTVMMIDAVFLSLLTIWRMVALDWVMAVFLSIPLLLIVVWGALVEKFMSNKWEARQKAFDHVYDFSQESFTGISVIKAFVKETQQLHEFASVAKKDKEENISFVRVSVLFDVTIEIIIAVIMAFLIGMGGFFVYRLVTGNPVVLFGHAMDLSAGELVTFIGYFETLIWPMIAMGQIVTMHSRARASLKRISRFMTEEEEISAPENAVTLENIAGRITFRNFSFSYPGAEDEALHDLTFEIEPGETIGVVGKIGCGKSTLAACLLRLYNVEAGTLFFDGVDVMDCTPASVRNAVAYVPQDNFLFSDKIRNNIAFARPDATEEEIEAAAKFADVHDNIVAFSDGYDTVSGERGVTLSGGQKQRISIARAYLKDAPIMILDDSVSAVDVKTEEEILANIARARRGKTTVVIASRVSTVSHMSRILVLDNGRVEAFDTPARLMETSPTYQKMVYLQALEREVEGGKV